MAYSSGTVASASALVSAIQAFAAANGWTVVNDTTDSYYISKGDVYVHLWVYSANEVRIQGARGGTWTAPDICGRYAALKFNGTTYTWPATASYYLFYGGTPDTLYCVMNWDVVRWFHIGFGMMTKLGSWTGGQWFFATNGQRFDGDHSKIRDHIDGGFMSLWTDESPALPFWSTKDGSQYAGGNVCTKNAFLHCELRGFIWEATGACDDNSISNIIHCPTVITPTQKRSPNQFNSQTILNPFDLYLRSTDGYYMPIGRPEHIRFVRLVTCNPNDTLTIGSENWRVYPAYRLDPSVPDGSYSGNSTGNLGIAVRYAP